MHYTCLLTPFSLIIGLAAMLLAPNAMVAEELTCAASDPDCLIQSIEAANATVEMDTIILPAGTTTLTSAHNDTDGPNGLPSITSPLTIQGAGAGATIIERGANTPTFRVVHVAPTGMLTLDGVTIRGGRTSGVNRGGGVLVMAGMLTVRNSTIANNDSPRGAGIYSNGILHLMSSTVFGNTGAEGGGLWNAGTLTLANVTVAGNRGNQGGGLWNSGTTTVRETAVTGNSASEGGGVYNLGTLDLVNTTIGQNEGGVGSGLWNAGTSAITNSTIARNMADEGGGLWNSGVIQLHNTILALNAATSGSDCLGITVSLGHNFFGNIDGCSVALHPNDRVGDSGLGAFVANRTPGREHFPLRSGSLAIDQADASVCPVIDQLGALRGEVCDIGAVEFHEVIDRPAVGGAVTGLELVRVMCHNQTQSATVTIDAPNRTSWDCEAAGLGVEIGDAISIEIEGIVPFPQTP